MADTIKVRPSADNTAVKVATDDISGTHYPIYKTAYGADGSVTQVDATNPLPVGNTAATPVFTKDFLLAVAMGEVTGHSIVNKFGQNDDLNTSTYEDIWDGGGVYDWPADATAPITHVVSTDAGDTGVCEVQGLDVNGDLVIQSPTLTGTTPVVLGTALWRVFRLKNTGSAEYVGVVRAFNNGSPDICLLYTSPSPRDRS